MTASYTNFNRDVYIVHSMPKTGTTSLAKALISLGVGEKDHGWMPSLVDKYKVEIDASNRLLQPFNRVDEVPGKLAGLVVSLMSDFVDEVSTHNIFSDFPVGHVRISPVVKKVLFPRAKLIWIDRDLDSWVNSVYKWEKTHPDVYPNFDVEWKDFSQKKQKLVHRYNRERKKICSLYQEFPADILITNIESGWEPLCAFLNVDVPEKEYPHANAAKS